MTETMRDDTSAPPLPPGTRLHEFVLGEPLGRGGLGIVYRAHHEILCDTFAIKEFLPAELAFREPGGQVRAQPGKEYLFDQVRAKFLAEGQTLIQLARPRPHPNLVQVTDAFRDHDTVYLCMRFEQCRPFDAILRIEPRPDESRLRAWLMPLLDGLEHAHSHHVWHRDIKPSNILIRDDDSPLLIDFGAARHEQPDSQVSIIAQYTPCFAAPEQVFGGPQGPWTDIYALAATWYFALTGTPPPQWSLGLDWSQAFAGQYSRSLLQSLEAGLRFDARSRPQSVADWRALLLVDDDQPTRLIDRQRPPAGATARSAPEVQAAAKDSRKAMRILAMAGLSGLGLAALTILIAWVMARPPGLSVPAASPPEEPLLSPPSGIPAACPLPDTPVCALIAALDAASPSGMHRPEGLVLQFNRADKVYHEGDYLSFMIENTGPAGGYLMLDVIDQQGRVVHLFPTRGRPDNYVAPGGRLTVGAPDADSCARQPDTCFEVAPPHGPLLLLMFWTERPLFERPRLPQSEPLEDYWAALEPHPREGIGKPPGALIFDYHAFVTRP